MNDIKAEKDSSVKRVTYVIKLLTSKATKKTIFLLNCPFVDTILLYCNSLAQLGLGFFFSQSTKQKVEPLHTEIKHAIVTE